MNLCGVQVDQQVFREDCSTSNLLPDPPGCGACVESEEQSDDMEKKTRGAPGKNKGIRVEGRVGVTTRSPKPDTVSTVATAKRSRRNSLDCIEEIWDDTIPVTPPLNAQVAHDDHGGNISGSDVPHRAILSTPTSGNRDNTHTPSRLYVPNSLHTCSSISLNAMNSPDWESGPLFCPTLDNSLVSSTAPYDDLLKRIEEGFRVRLVEVPPSSCCIAMERAHLYLHCDRTRLCLQSMEKVDEKKDEALQFGIEIELHQIHRIEVGRHCQSRRSFSLVLLKDSAVSYYDFEAASILEREIIISTLMVLLDQTSNTATGSQQAYFSESVDDSYDRGFSGGTIDQPILCSPSLEQESRLSYDQGTHYLSWEQGGSHQQQVLSGDSYRDLPERKETDTPTRRQCFPSQSPTPGDSPTPSFSLLPRYSIQQSSLLRQSPDTFPEDECKAATPSSHLENKLSLVSSWAIPEETVGRITPRQVVAPLISPVPNGYELSMRRSEEGEPQLALTNSNFVATEPWCSDDVCSLALRDLADTCTGIFAMKPEDGMARKSMSYSVCLAASDQHELVEEYIKTALGAPDAVCSCIMEGDVWNAEEASPAPEDTEKPKSFSRQVRNRAHLLNAQASRLRTLRNEMTFVSALKKSRERMHYIKTTQSFDDADPFSTKSRAALKAADQFHSSALLKHVVDAMMLNESDETTSGDEVAFYDSDPEDIRPRTIRKRGPRRVEADRLNTQLNESSSPRARTRSLDKIPSKRRVKKLDEDVIKDIVQVSFATLCQAFWTIPFLCSPLHYYLRDKDDE